MDGPSIRVLVTAFAPVPGTSPHATALLGMATALHAEFEMVTIKTESYSHVEELGGARMFRVPVGVGDAGEQREAFGRAVARQLEAQPYDVVHVRGAIEGSVVADRRRDLGFRFVYEIATYPDEAEGADVERRWMQADERCAEEADLILVATQAAARSLGERGHAGKVAVVPPGVDVNTFDWWPAIAGDTHRLLYLGTFGADRDLGTLLGAVRILSKDWPVELLIAGDADIDRRERLRTVVRSFGLEDAVTVRGEPRANAIPLLIGASDVCVAAAAATPRFQDMGDLPQPLLEYFACRRPVVAAGVPGLADILRDDKEGLIYAPGDEASLAEAIATIFSEETLRERLVELAYDRVRWLFSDGARRRRVAEVYEMLMTGSQQYDPWVEGFERDVTGLIQVPDDMFDADDEPVTEPPREVGDPPTSIAAEDLVVVADTDDEDHPTPAWGERPDASPGLAGADTQVRDMPVAKTVIGAPPALLEEADGADEHLVEADEATHELPAPEGGEPDTGPVKSPRRLREVDTQH